MYLTAVTLLSLGVVNGPLAAFAGKTDAEKVTFVAASVYHDDFLTP